MATVKPFQALRPVPEKARTIASVPYDVVDSAEAQTLAADNPISFLHVIRSEIDLPAGTDLYAGLVYEKAAENLSRLKADKLLVQESAPSLYLYKLKMAGQEQIGLACCCAVAEYERDLIRKHEHTRREKEDDRLRHMLTLRAHTGPVLLTYRGTEAINRLVRAEISREPLYHFTAPDGVGHTLWRVSDSATLVEAFREVPLLYIADGHHRAAGAYRVKQEMLARDPQAAAEEEFNYFLCVLFPAAQLRIFPYNRYVSDLGGLQAEAFLQTVKERFTLSPTEVPEPPVKGQFGMYLDGQWYRLKLGGQPQQNPPDPVSVLDLTQFQNHLLEPVLGIKDQKKDKRVDFVGGAESAAKLKERVDQEGGVAFTFYPVSVEELLAVADAGLIMPPKSTWFAPKLRSGLLIHSF